jgi:hypothetical protein
MQKSIHGNGKWPSLCCLVSGWRFEKRQTANFPLALPSQRNDRVKTIRQMSQFQETDSFQRFQLVRPVLRPHARTDFRMAESAECSASWNEWLKRPMMEGTIRQGWDMTRRRGVCKIDLVGFGASFRTVNHSFLVRYCSSAINPVSPSTVKEEQAWSDHY